MMRTLIFGVTILLLSGCAGQRVPEGGPIDTTPPEIISVYPAPNTVNYTEKKIILEFSEYVDRASVQRSIFISPAIPNVEFDWSSTEVELDFTEDLKPQTTYVVTVGTDVKDVRQGNKMTNAFSLAFSTGEKIDKGIIRGKVFDDKPDGVMIFSYRINDIEPDTLNPTHTRPGYITQTGKDGSFTLTNLANGIYRLFAIRDTYGNLLYDPEADDAGTTADVELSDVDTVRSHVQFILAKEDTTAPRIQSVGTADNRHVTVNFSEPVISVSRASFVIADTIDGTPLPVTSLFPANDALSVFTLVTARQQEGAPYMVTVHSIEDHSGHIINPLADRKSFPGSGVNDTLPPAIASLSIKDSTTMLLPSDSIQISFSDAVLCSSDDSLVTIRQQDTGADVPDRVIWRYPSVCIVRPLAPFTMRQQYTLTLHWKYVRDESGNGYRDTVSVFHFSTIDPDLFGSIEGSFAGFGSTFPVIIEGSNIRSKSQKHSFVKVDSAGAFKMDLLPEGNYVLKAFEDRNGNGIDDAGSVFPFRRSEQFRYYPDTIRVRPRWPVDGVILR